MEKNEIFFLGEEKRLSQKARLYFENVIPIKIDGKAKL